MTFLLAHLLAFAATGSTSLAAPETTPFAIEKAEMVFNSDEDRENDYTLLVTFNQPLSKRDLTPPGWPRKQPRYGFKLWIESVTGWKREPSRIKTIDQEYFTHNNNYSYEFAYESEFHPLRSYREDTDKGFRKGKIKHLLVELYEQDKDGNGSYDDYRLIQTFSADNL